MTIRRRLIFSLVIPRSYIWEFTFHEGDELQFIKERGAWERKSVIFQKKRLAIMTSLLDLIAQECHIISPNKHIFGIMNRKMYKIYYVMKFIPFWANEDMSVVNRNFWFQKGSCCGWCNLDKRDNNKKVPT